MDDDIIYLLLGCESDIHVTVKIESADSIPNLHSIISASDGVWLFNIIFIILSVIHFLFYLKQKHITDFMMPVKNLWLPAGDFRNLCLTLQEALFLNLETVFRQ